MPKVEVRGSASAASKRVLTPEAVAFLGELEQAFGARRRELLAARVRRYAELASGKRPTFRADTRRLREDSWRVAPAPEDLQDRRVEITGPTDRKLVINALNSGARVFMADFEDANTPTWSNLVEGQANLIDAARGTISFTSPQGKEYRLGKKPATLLARARGWHLEEKHVWVDGRPMSGALFDAGLYVFHNAKALAAAGSGAYFYLAKLESAEEARLWNDALAFCEARVGIRRGAVRTTVLLETVLAAFEMEEILYELRERSTGLNAGRWDYLFSVIKKFRAWPSLEVPDRAQWTMTVPFMRAYTSLIVRACHRRGAHAMGGMSAFIPNRKDPEATATAIQQVRADKQREVSDGFDGTWVAHPDLVPVAMQVFDEGLGGRPNQVSRLREDVVPSEAALLDFRVEGGRVTDAGLRNNVDVALQYLESWLRGAGAVGIHDLMEDAATAEIARSQIWFWLQRNQRTESGTRVTHDHVRRLLKAASAALETAWGPDLTRRSRLADARRLFETVALGTDWIDFLTLPGYQMLEA